jgi:hypothetical protein
VAYQLVFAGISIFYFQGARSKFSFDDLTYQIQHLWMDPSQEALQYNRGCDPAINLQVGANQYPSQMTMFQKEMNVYSRHLLNIPEVSYPNLLKENL